MQTKNLIYTVSYHPRDYLEVLHRIRFTWEGIIELGCLGCLRPISTRYKITINDRDGSGYSAYTSSKSTIWDIQM